MRCLRGGGTSATRRRTTAQLDLPGAKAIRLEGLHNTPLAHLWQVQYSGVVNAAFDVLGSERNLRGLTSSGSSVAMDKGDRGREVNLLSRRSAALWGQLQAARAPKGLGGLVRRLDRAHRRLARLDAELPPTATVRRYRRRCLEVLQSQDAQVEALLAALAASTVELTALADRQLELSRAALELEPPVLTARSWRGGPRLVEVSAVLALLGVFACSKWPWMFFGGAIVAMLFLGQRTHPRLEFKFDGRSLRVVRRLFGIEYGSTNVDLAHFNDVVVTAAGLAVSSPDGLVVLDTQPAGREIEFLAAQVREWCVCAARTLLTREDSWKSSRRT